MDAFQAAGPQPVAAQVVQAEVAVEGGDQGRHAADLVRPQGAVHEVALQVVAEEVGQLQGRGAQVRALFAGLGREAGLRRVEEAFVLAGVRGDQASDRDVARLEVAQLPPRHTPTVRPAAGVRTRRCAGLRPGSGR